MSYGRQSTISPALLTSQIKQARTLDALFHTYAINASSVNHIHLSACWNSLGHLAKSADQHWFKQHATVLESMVQHTISTVSKQEIQARQLANIAHGVARSGRGQFLVPLMMALARSIEQCLGDCNAQELANAAWAFSKSGLFDAQFFQALARVVRRRIGELNAQEIANTLWAFATAGHSDVKLSMAIAVVAEKRLDDFNAQGLANTAWAFAKLGHFDAKLFTALARSAEKRLDDFNAQDFAHTAWAFAKAGHLDVQLFTALARSAEWHLSSFNAQGLANTAWAFAKAGQLDAKLFAALARSMEQRLSELSAKDIANIAWAFAKACHQDTPLFTALARSAKTRLGDFNVQDLVNTAWAFAKLGHPDEQLFAVLARSIEQLVSDFDAQHLVNAAWAFAKAGQLDAQLFSALARAAERRLSDFSTQDIVTIAWAFANADQLDAQLFAALARSAEQHMGDINDEDIENTAWAFAKAGQRRLAKRLRQRRGSGVTTDEVDEEAATLAALAPPGPAGVPAGVPRGVPTGAQCGLIVVAGGGLGGAAVALALQKKGFDVAVLEADASFDARKQGYGLTIQSADAVRALGMSLAEEDAPATSHYIFSAEGHILGVFGEAFRQSKGRRIPSVSTAGRFIHLPRQMLRSKIIDQIRPGTIRWNSKLKNFSCCSDNDLSHGTGVTVTLIDDTIIKASLLVGADGIFSTVRRQLALPGDRLNYIGLIVVLGIVSATALPLPQHRIFETVDGTTRIYVMPFTANLTMWQLSFPCIEDVAKALAKNPAALKADILQRCGRWHEPIPQLLHNTQLDCMSGYPVYDRDPLDPVVLRAVPKQGAVPMRRVTLLGDAAHPMSPFRAQGANQALCDAVLLADILEDSVRRHGPKTGLDSALLLFEHKMLNRSARMVLASREKAKELHSSVAMRPARKVQRENGVDMNEIIRVLQAKGIGAHSASDPRGLDALVAEVIDASGRGVTFTATKESRNDSKRKQDAVAGNDPDEITARSMTESTTCSSDKSLLWGYFDDEWHKCILLKTTRNGHHKVQWNDGTTSVLDPDCIQLRVKRTRTQ